MTDPKFVDEEMDHQEKKENTEEIEDATWGDVFRTCCVHDAKEWGIIFLGLVGVCFFLYFFLVGLDLLGEGAKVVGGCTAGALFGDSSNPVASLMVGILATVLIQSSSSTTSIIVSLVSAQSVSVKAGIYMVMGANIGTSVTNTIVALGHLGDGDELERAFAGATVHDMFNFLSVGVLFPLEIITHYLYYLTLAMVGGGDKNRVGQGEDWSGPLKKIVGPLTKAIIVANKNVAKDIAKGGSCDSYYPTNCTDGILNYKNCKKVGLIACDKKSGCPAFFQNGASRRDDEISGAVVFVLGIAVLVICLIGLVALLQKMLMGMSNRILYKATNVNGYLAIVIGAAVTVLVQSSSITTSALTPFVGVGALRLEQMLPLTLGANLGTTVTGLLASLVADGTDSLQVALCHLMFNVSGIIIWYPVPFMRNIPLSAARQLGRATRIWKGFPIMYIAVAFVFIPMILLGLSSLFDQDSKGFTVLGSFLVIILVLVLAYIVYKWKRGGLRESTVERFEKRQRRNQTLSALDDDMDYMKSELVRLREHTGLAEPTIEAEKVGKDEKFEDA
jgi:sodium-dependent phosphate cotransporter